MDHWDLMALQYSSTKPGRNVSIFLLRAAFKNGTEKNQPEDRIILIPKGNKSGNI